MKIIYAILFISFTVVGTAQNCNTSVSTDVFQQKFNQMASKPDDYAKYVFGGNFANSKCLTSHQVKLMATIFVDDVYRLEFCKIAYTRTSDVNNFYDVYDVFSKFSSAFRLHDYVNGISNTATVIEVASTVEIPVEEVPCAPTNAEYETMSKSIDKESFDDNKMTIAKQILKHNCLNISQIKGIMGKFTFSKRKLEFAQVAYVKCPEQKNYYQLAEAFTFLNDKKDFNSWLDKQ